ncbi:MAG: DUF4147 domain-containing protein, partial [candidate division Zixibacteria bacterium]|nr:DUF4147 domain-containing protein [candidate division Zixibacteria bacterium]
INTLRKHVSLVKGGQLARLAYPATLVTLILSDVIDDPLDIIASGPTVPDPSTFANCLRILEKYGLSGRLPGAIENHLIAGSRGHAMETPKSGDAVFEKVCNVVIASNLQALEAAQHGATRRGYRTLILSSAIDGETREIARIYAAMAKEIRRSGHPLPPPVCIVSGGETTVTIRGKGKGGRNQEFALASAMGIDGLDNVVVFSAGTDGTDGPTDAAGAVADGMTIARAATLGYEAEKHLTDNNAYPFFAALGDLIVTGPTGTNVMDLRLLMVG